jgi:hypothetical protein
MLDVSYNSVNIHSYSKDEASSEWDTYAIDWSAVINSIDYD